MSTRQADSENNTPPEHDDDALRAFFAQPDEGFLKLLRDSIATLDEIDTERDDLNARKKAVLENLATKGVNKKAFMAARQYLALKEKHQELWDLSYQVTRRAGGDPVQFELFDAQVAETQRRAKK
jgi:hypothetical protein